MLGRFGGERRRYQALTLLLAKQLALSKAAAHF